jgi:hypothetical protein
LKAGVWFRRGRLVIVSPGLQPFWLLSGRNSTYPVVQISRASSDLRMDFSWLAWISVTAGVISIVANAPKAWLTCRKVWRLLTS